MTFLHAVRPFTEIRDQVAVYYDVPVKDMLCSRIGRCLDARISLWWILRKVNADSFTTIAKLTGSDHASVIRGVREAERRTDEDDLFRARLRELEDWSRDVTEHPTMFPDVVSPARRSDPPTSHEAALLAFPRSGSWQEKALKHFIEAGNDGLTDYELSVKLIRFNMRGSVSKIRGHLREAGWVEDSCHTRLTDTGTRAIVWRATAKAMQAARRGQLPA